MGGLEESTKFSIARGVGTELDRKWRITRPFTFTGPSKPFPDFSTLLKVGHVKTGNRRTHCTATQDEYTCILASSKESNQTFATLPPGGLILFLSDWLRPLTEGWAFAKGVEKTATMASQPVALSSNVGRVLDDQLVVGSQAHIFRPLQETLNTVPLFLLGGQPVMETLSSQPTTHNC